MPRPQPFSSADPKPALFSSWNLVTILLLLIALPASAGKNAKLPPRYQTWLTKDVAYIITRDETDAFRALPTDADRDKFIERFWEVRNPTPGAPTNPYKDEHYQRLEYASLHFAPSGRNDGWNTDMGRVYITLGAPMQKARYVAQSGVRGMEIWFYSNAHPALPPFFSVIFYEKDFGDFRLYSPYIDGPQKLVTGIQAEQGRVQAVQQIDHILGREVALNTLSLIPDEPVNINDAESTMHSDLMLGNIHDLANHPFTLEQLRMRRALSEEVTHRVLLPGDLLNLVCVPLRDARGEIRVHYALRLPQPEDFAVAQADQRYYYSIESLVRVQTPEGKEIFNRRRKIAKYLSKDELEPLKGKPLEYEGWLPIPPGEYKINFVFTNLLTKTAFTGERAITVPDTATQAFSVTDPVLFSKAETADPAQAEILPFTGGGVRFSPYVAHELALVPGQDLKFFYQVWRSAPAAGSAAANGAGSPAGGGLQADYAYGRPNFTGSAQTIHDELPKGQFDSHGSMISGKKIDTTHLGAGTYRLTISVTDPETRQKHSSGSSFRIVTEDPSPSETWRIDDDGLAEYATSGQADFDRGMAYLAKRQSQAAGRCFLEALRKDPSNERSRAQVINYYFQQQQFGKIVDLIARIPVTPQTEEGAILRAAYSLDKVGKSNMAVELLESTLKVKPPSGPLYLALSDYYQHLGNSGQAEAFQRKGRELMAETTSDR